MEIGIESRPMAQLAYTLLSDIIFIFFILRLLMLAFIAACGGELMGFGRLPMCRPGELGLDLITSALTVQGENAGCIRAWTRRCDPTWPPRKNHKLGLIVKTTSPKEPFRSQASSKLSPFPACQRWLLASSSSWSRERFL